MLIRVNSFFFLTIQYIWCFQLCYKNEILMLLNLQKWCANPDGQIIFAYCIFGCWAGNQKTAGLSLARDEGGRHGKLWAVYPWARYNFLTQIDPAVYFSSSKRFIYLFVILHPLIGKSMYQIATKLFLDEEQISELDQVCKVRGIKSLMVFCTAVLGRNFCANIWFSPKLFLSRIICKVVVWLCGTKYLLIFTTSQLDMLMTSGINGIVS